MLRRGRPALPRGHLSPQGSGPLSPALSCSHAGHPRARQRTAPALSPRKAAALCISIPRRAASARSLRCQRPQGHGTNPDAPATGSPASRGCRAAHLPESQLEPGAHLALRARGVSKQICLQGVCPAACRHPGVKEPAGRRPPRDEDTAGSG